MDERVDAERRAARLLHASDRDALHAAGPTDSAATRVGNSDEGATTKRDDDDDDDDDNDNDERGDW